MPPPPSATYQRLRHYIAERMHEPYLPALDADGTARPPQPGPGAGRGPADPGKGMVGKVPTGNGITRCEKGTYALVGGEELIDTERDELQQLCRQRLDVFRERHGAEVFAHRSRNRSPISGSVKYRVLTRARGRCECCGAVCCLANPAPAGSGGGPHHSRRRSLPRSGGTRAAPTPSPTCRLSVSTDIENCTTSDTEK